jgi:DNA-binding response OmpR family regulator
MNERREILVIEDEALIRGLIKGFLSHENYSITTAESLDTAISALENKAYDIIITDLMLPYTGGLELIEQIRHHPMQKKSQIIVITGMDKDILNATIMDNVDAVLTKPLSFLDLLKTIQNSTI